MDGFEFGGVEVGGNWAAAWAHGHCPWTGAREIPVLAISKYLYRVACIFHNGVEMN